MGNGSCGTSFEDPGDYQLSICGIYWLNYENGIVSGPLFSEGAEESVTVAEFSDLVNGCLSTGIRTSGNTDPLTVRYLDGAPIIEMIPGASDLVLFDLRGRLVFRRAWNGSPLRLEGLGPGSFTVQASRGAQRWTRKLIVL